MTATKPIIALALGGALFLSGCEGTGPNQQAGAFAGAVLGGLIGATRPGSDAGSAVVGATLGGIAGGAIGAALDAQAGELRSGLTPAHSTVTNTGEELVVTMSGDILFTPGSAVVRPGAEAELRRIAQNLLQHPNSTVEVIGHTDNVGSAAANLDLSRRRAAAVAGVLTAYGVSPDRIVAIGRGEAEPIASNLTPEGRAANRRVEIIIHPR